MMIDLPPPLTGNSPQIVWLNRLRAAVQRAFALEAPGTLATVTPFGTHRQSTARRATSAAAPSGTKQFRVKSVQGDYLTCRTWGGPVGAEVEGSVDILVAKLPELRHSWGHDNGDGSYTEYNVDGKDLTYTYQARSGVVDGQRTETDGTVTTVSIVVPVWHCAEATGAPYSVIYADQPTGGTGLSVDGVDVLWLMRDYRYWARVTS